MSAFIRYVPISIGGGGSGALSMGALDGVSPSANGASISTGHLYMQSASATAVGLVNITTQSFAGQKTFTTGLTGTLTGSASLNVLTSALGNLTDAGTDGITVTGGTGATVGAVSLSQHVADTTHNGYLSSTDWNTFNGKQAAGSYITALTGDVTATGPGSVAATVAKIQGTTVSGTTGSTNVVFSTAPTLSNPVVGTQSTSDNSTLAASTAYVTTAIANAVAGVNPSVAVQAATTQASDTSGLTYLNGVAGIGATLTGSVNTAITIDGYTFTALGQRLLVKNDTQSPSGAHNGMYYVTQVQTGILPPILTRALDYDTPSDINNTGAIPVINGTANVDTSWIITSTVNTVGTDPLTFLQFTKNPADFLLKANNLSDVANTTTSFNNLSGMTTLGDIIYGGASGTRSRLAGNTATSTTLLSSVGSGGLATAPAWLTATNANTASTAILRDSSGNFSAGTITAALTGTASGNTTYTANNHGLVLSSATNAMTVVAPDASTAKALISGGSSADPAWGILAIAGGGTGQVTKAAAFDALSPMTTGGDIIYGGASGTGTRLANGTAGQVLQSNGTTLAPTWVSPTASQNYFSGYFSDSAQWTTTSTTFVDGTNSGGNTLTTVYNSGISPTAAASNICGLTITPPTTTAAYEVTFLMDVDNATTGDDGTVRIYDGTTMLGTQKFRGGGGSVRFPLTVSGIWKPGTTSSSTIKIQFAVNAGTFETISNSTSGVSVWMLMKQIAL